MEDLHHRHQDQQKHHRRLGVNKHGKRIQRNRRQQPPPLISIQQGLCSSSTSAAHNSKQQPHVYHISKYHFRSVVQELTGGPRSTPCLQTPTPPPPNPPCSVRLQKIRPPPLTISAPVPLPPPSTACAESPVSAYVRFLERSLSSDTPRWLTPSPYLRSPSPGDEAFTNRNPLPPPPPAFSNLLPPKSPCLRCPLPLTPTPTPGFSLPPSPSGFPPMPSTGGWRSSLD